MINCCRFDAHIDTLGSEIALLKLPTDQFEKVYIICGPTAVGKTDVAIELALRLGTCIISADSRQCYRGMSIGTAKPPPEALGKVKHYFIDEFPVTDILNAADFDELCCCNFPTSAMAQATSIKSLACPASCCASCKLFADSSGCSPS